jgi:hypothetical protein
VLQILIHGDDQLAARLAKAGHEGVVLAVVAHKLHSHDPVRIGNLQITNHFPRAVLAAIVHKDDLERTAPAVEHRDELRNQVGQGQGAVIDGNDDRNVHKKNLVLLFPPSATPAGRLV